ncbi:hypothetical protein [Flavobacterium ovatum]|uniref:hypothetical protein n=1 Tax=Flavobacterium ovatum TaxID=1928857 RepID=UPI00344EEA1D
MKHADRALIAIEVKANDINAKGVAIVCFISGNSVQSWISKIKVIGTLSDEKANLLAITSAKAAEIAETLKNSDDKNRKLKVGELGWIGVVVWLSFSVFFRSSE